MKFSFFNSQPSNRQILQRSEQRLAEILQNREEMEATRQQLLHRQVELWSVLTPSSDLEDEYKSVSSEIAILIQKEQGLDEFIKRFRLCDYHCRQGQCEEISAILEIEDPFEGKTFEVKPIVF